MNFHPQAYKTLTTLWAQRGKRLVCQHVTRIYCCLLQAAQPAQTGITGPTPILPRRRHALTRDMISHASSTRTKSPPGGGAGAISVIEGKQS